MELLVRGVAVGAFLGLAIAVARGERSSARLSGVLFALAAAGHTLDRPELEPLLGVVRPIVWSMSALSAGLFWAFARDLFGDGRQAQSWWRFAPAVILLAVALSTSAGVWPERVWMAYSVLSGGLLVHVLFLILTGWRNDLVESRRRLRGPVLAAAALYALSVSGEDAVRLLTHVALYGSLADAVILAGLGLAAVGVLLSVDPAVFAPAPAARTDAPGPAPEALAGDDARLAAALSKLMDVDKGYRDDALTIALLAQRLGAPEYRVRRLINGRLGYRNFNEFINEHRLSDATQALADPAQREVPIATIALDAGFSSLGPFNRAFKLRTGVTPSEFRARALAQITTGVGQAGKG